jgi:methionine-rich copper-binding protein CopC
MDRIKSSRHWLVGMALAIALIGLLDAQPALAHAVPDRAMPSMNTAVPVMPSTIEIWFSEEVKPEGTSIQVLRLDGTQVDQGNSAVDLQDPTRTRVTVGVHSGLDNGEYLVQWTAVSAIDDDTTSGSYRFTVDPTASPAPLPQIATQQAPAQLPEINSEGEPVDSERNTLLYGIVAAITGLAFIGLIVFWYFRRAAHGRRWSDRPVDRL